MSDARDASRRDGGAADASDAALEDAAPKFDGNCTCHEAGSCSPIALVSGQSSPYRLTADSTGVYWTNADNANISNGSIWRVNLDGTDPAILAVNQIYPTSIARGNGLVYWIDGAGGDLRRCDPSACDASALATGLMGVQGLGLSATAAYVGEGLSTSRILAFNLLDASVTVITSNAGTPDRVATDGTNVYWTGSSAVYGCPLNGCGDAGPTMYGASSHPAFIAVSGGTIFWTDPDDHVVYSVPTSDGGTVSTVLTLTANPSIESTPGGIAVDAKYIYITTATQILRVDLDGGNLVTIATGGQPTDVALADGGTCVYWVDDTPDAGHVYASAK